MYALKEDMTYGHNRRPFPFPLLHTAWHNKLAQCFCGFLKEFYLFSCFLGFFKGLMFFVKLSIFPFKFCYKIKLICLQNFLKLNISYSEFILTNEDFKIF
jgi:hypothetical protein